MDAKLASLARAVAGRELTLTPIEIRRLGHRREIRSRIAVGLPLGAVAVVLLAVLVPLAGSHRHTRPTASPTSLRPPPVAAGSCYSPAPGTRAVAYVLTATGPSYDAGTVTAVDLTTHRVLWSSPLPTGSGTPDAVAFASATDTAWVLSHTGQVHGGLPTELTPLNVTTDTFGSAIRLGVVTGGGVGLALSPNGLLAYVPTGIATPLIPANDALIPVDLTTRHVEAPLLVGENPLSVAFAPNGRLAYVSTESGLSIVDVAKSREIGNVPYPTLPTTPSSDWFSPGVVAVSPSGTEAVVGTIPLDLTSSPPVVMVFNLRTRQAKVIGIPKEASYGRPMNSSFSFTCDGSDVFVTGPGLVSRIELPSAGVTTIEARARKPVVPSADITPFAEVVPGGRQTWIASPFYNGYHSVTQQTILFSVAAGTTSPGPGFPVANGRPVGIAISSRA
ncbi:MAG: hypothetical protein ACRD0Z_08600 [Acidimicrobiales bacterium]